MSKVINMVDRASKVEARLIEKMKRAFKGFESTPDFYIGVWWDDAINGQLVMEHVDLLDPSQAREDLADMAGIIYDDPHALFVSKHYARPSFGDFRRGCMPAVSIKFKVL